MKEGELARLQLKCKMVEIKRIYVGLLEIIKREHELGGIPIEPPDPSPQHFSRQSEQDVKMNEQARITMFDKRVSEGYDNTKPRSQLAFGRLLGFIIGGDPQAEV